MISTFNFNSIWNLFVNTQHEEAGPPQVAFALGGKVTLKHYIEND